MPRRSHPSDRTIGLPDGRSLGFAEFGDPAGRPVVWCHGGLSSRLDAAGSSDAACAAGVRVLAPDRPGVGISEVQPGRSLLDWGGDVSALADELGIDRFAVLGWSFGGPYAAACGVALGPRVTHVGLIASSIPADWPEMIDDINSMDERFIRRSEKSPLLARAVFRGMGFVAGRAPNLFARAAAREEDPVSARAIARDAHGFSFAISEGLVNGSGVVEEYRIMSEPWGFDLGALSPPTTLWQGDADTLLPHTWAPRLAAEMPNSTLVEKPGEGHFLAHDNWGEIFAASKPR